MRFSLSVLFLYLASFASVSAETRVLEPESLFLRNTGPREWDHFPEQVSGEKYSLSFDLAEPGIYRLLTLRQEETKQAWEVVLNETRIGTLLRDHNHLERGIRIPEGLLRESGNHLEILTRSETPDDIRIGGIRLHSRELPLLEPAREEVYRQQRGFHRPVPDMSATVTLTATDAETGLPLPSRFTIIDAETGALVFIGAESDDRIAIREGVVYSIDGSASFRLAGDAENPRSYRVFCGRGFEYSLDEQTLAVDGSKENHSLAFTLRREVQTPGLVACDPHLHTYEFDRHGDCSVVERLISIAGEGVELPVSTAHDKHIDYAVEAERIGASKWFTAVTGCEVTTHQGHFNSFPVRADAPPAEHKLRPWAQVFQNIFATPDVKVCILNHGRDVHRNFTPLAPENFDRETGTFRDGRVLRANAMELINSGAQQTDPMEIIHDWFALLRNGHSIAGIGSSDSHTVNFAIPGQARTYLRCRDEDPSAIPVEEAVSAFLDGRTMVSFGLLTKLDQTGDRVDISVQGPGWTTATEVRIFQNGSEVKRYPVDGSAGTRPGIKFTMSLSLKELSLEPGDFLCAVATGPGITDGWWPIMPPYQPDSPVFSPFVMGISEIVRLSP